jgi:hypothetical protein
MMDSHFALSRQDLPCLYPFELNSLQKGSSSSRDPHLVAFLKVPQDVREQRCKAQECLICCDSLKLPNGHVWRNCPRINTMLEDSD